MASVIPQTITRALCAAVRQYLPGALRELLQALSLSLSEYSLQAFSNREAEGCEQLQGFCRLRGEAMLATLIEHLCHDLEYGEIEPPSELLLDNSSAWSLVEDAEVDDLLEAKRLVRGLRETLGPLEWQLCACLARLTGHFAREGASPLSLEYLVRQLQEALQLRQHGPLARRAFQDSLSRVLSGALLSYLQALLAVFQQHRIEPLTPPQSLERPIRGSVPYRQQAQAKPYQAFHELRQTRGQLQIDEGVAAAGSWAPDVDSSHIRQSFQQLRVQPEATSWQAARWLHELQRQGCALSPRQKEDGALVGALFKALGEDQRIAPALREPLQQLMPNVLQASLQDGQVFADQSHPLRATLDRLLQLSDACDPPNRALETRIESVLQRIAEEFHGDLAVLDQYQRELESLLAVQQRTYRANAERVMQYHRGQDTLKRARLRVQQLVFEPYGEQVPQVLLDWLAAGWQELLVHELLREGEGSVGWRADMALLKLLKRWLDGDVGAGELLERSSQADHLLGLLRRRLDDFQAGQYRYLEVLGELRRQLLGEEPVHWVARPPTEPAVAPVLLEGQERWQERLAQLQMGDWLQDAEGRALHLVWVDSAHEHFVLSDAQGREAGSYVAAQMLERLASAELLPGEAQEDGPGPIQNTLQGIVGRLYREIAHARSHDELTGLLNRRSFELAVAQCLAKPGPHSLLQAHVDLFVLVNQQVGSLGGDACLRQLATQLAQNLPGDAYLARIGGVDFALILPHHNEAQALELAETWRAMIEREGFVWEGRRLDLSLSTGVLEANKRHEVLSVFSDLQSACSAAKQEGRNRVCSFREQVVEQGGLLAIAARVDEIVEREQLSLRLQPIVPLAEDNEELMHHELLLVMENDLQLIDFISAAERYQRMPRVDRWVLKRIFTALEHNPQVWQHSSSISINLSGSSVNDDKLLGFIENLFEQHRIDPSRICFELTETAAVANLAKTADLVRHLQSAGCRFSIDDFGVGFSSFDYLKRLPVDYVKIDGSFVREIELSEGDLAMVRSINEIAHALGRQTIAEYVESPSIARRLREMGVDYAQGFGVGKPLPLERWLSL